MPINTDKPHFWKADVALSVDFCNNCFPRFASDVYRKQRIIRIKKVLDTLGNLGCMCCRRFSNRQ